MAFASINQASVGGGSSNALAIQSDGIFMPRLSTGQRTALALTTSDAGLTVYDFTLNNLFIWNGTAWESIPGSGDAGANGSVQYNDNGIVSGASNFVWDKVNSRVGIGTASPNYILDISGATPRLHIRDNGTGSSLVDIENGAGTLYVGRENSTGSGGLSGVPYAGIMYLQGAYPLIFGTNFVERARFNSTGAFVLAGGTTTANGIGIAFPAVQVASSDANCLDDYEEGTWTGTLTGATTDPTIPVTSTGRYTKVGRLVTVQISFSNVTTTGASGQIKVTGLPFTNNGTASTGGTVLLYSMGTFTGSPVANVGLNESFLGLYSNITNAAFADVTHNAGVTRFLTTSITYTV